MNQPLTTCQMAEQLLRFEPGTPCVVHMWIADDFEDVAPALKPDEVPATIALADASLDADTTLSWYFLRHCADTIPAARVEKDPVRSSENRRRRDNPPVR